MLFYGITGVGFFGASLSHQCVLALEPLDAGVPIDPSATCLTATYTNSSVRRLRCPCIREDYPDDDSWRTACPYLNPQKFCKNPLSSSSSVLLGLTGSAFSHSNTCDRSQYSVCRRTPPEDSMNYGLTNFDNILNGWLTLFQVTTLSNWNSYMSALGTVENSFLSGLFLISLIFLVAFIVNNFFAAVITAVYSKEHEYWTNKDEEAEKIKKETRVPELEETRTSRRCSCLRPLWESSPEALHQLCRPIVHSTVFVRLYHVIILINVAVQCILTENTTEQGRNVIFAIQCACTGLHLVEFLAKWWGYGSLKEYLSNSDPRLVLRKEIPADWMDHVGEDIQPVFEAVPLEPDERTLLTWHTFDAIILVASVLSVIFRVAGFDSVNLGFMRVFRFLRYLRRFKHHYRLMTIYSACANSLVPSVKVAGLIVGFVIVFAAAGVQLFGNRRGEIVPSRIIRENFDTPSGALLVLFQVLTGDNWDTIMYYYMQQHPVTAALYFLAIFIITNYLLLFLFTAVMLQNFEPTEETKAFMQQVECINAALEQRNRKIKFYNRPQSFAESIARMRTWFATNSRFCACCDAEATRKVLEQELQVLPAPRSDPEAAQKAVELLSAMQKEVPEEQDTSRERSLGLFGPSNPIRWFCRRLVHKPPKAERRSTARKRMAKRRAMAAAAREAARKSGDVVYVPGTFGENEELDYTINYSRLFDTFFLIVTLVSCVTLALEPPRVADTLEAQTLRSSTRVWVLRLVDKIVLILFVVEFIVKVIADGLYYGRNIQQPPYLFDNWNKLDAMLLVVMVLSETLDSSSVRALRLVRALRPLRVVRKVESLRLTFAALWNSVSSIMIVLGIVVAITFGVALTGVGLFSGKYNYCNDSNLYAKANRCLYNATASQPSNLWFPNLGASTSCWHYDPKHTEYPFGTGKDQCVGLYQSDNGYLRPRVWGRPYSNFDNIIGATLTVFEVTSLSSWSPIMYSAADIVSRGEQPKQAASAPYSFFFIIAVVICAYFCITIFVAVLLSSMDDQNKRAYLTPKQREWSQVKTAMLKLKPKRLFVPPKSRFRVSCLAVVRRPAFIYFIRFAVFLNVILLATRSRYMSSTYEIFLRVTNYVFAAIFAIEAILKIIAFGMQYFITDNWNKFDFLVVILSIGAEFVPSDVVLGNVSRAIRIFKLLSIVKHTDQFRVASLYLDTLLSSLPSIMALGLLLLLLLYIYAVVGMQQYGNIKFQSDLNSDANFRTFTSSIFTLFRMATLDNWNDLMRNADLRASNGACTATATFNDCGGRSAVVYFTTFFAIGTYVFLNIVIAIIVDNFTYCFNQRDFMFQAKHLKQYRELWSTVDPKAKGWIPVRDFTAEYADGGKDLQSLILRLWQEANPLVYDEKDAYRAMHPFQSFGRVKYQHLLFELDFIRQELEEKEGDENLLVEYTEDGAQPMHITFSRVLLILGMMRMGVDALSRIEQFERTKFQEIRDREVASQCIRNWLFRLSGEAPIAERLRSVFASQMRPHDSWRSSSETETGDSEFSSVRGVTFSKSKSDWTSEREDTSEGEGDSASYFP
eukprot:TRINITY_DN9323_c0_g1_i1.p1 TRINITY_DN9323_c0_g1~~TRINITY_DN9323_c0_g1_i1.p1  ORF type:complete len:1795 (+),score=324.48 TRINITY_DN9323_c0_g1_i1:735-5387(+)